ncbi:MAG: AraC family transcriptional regulator [Lachnospiraceae bacterium]|nr:AraC family transcriptional regulator [Lachnospiraceae bacterium]
MKRTVPQQKIKRIVTNYKSTTPHVHYHDAYELYYMLDGNTTYYIGDRIYHIQSGNFVFIPRGILHRTDYESSEINERIYLHFSENIFTNELQEIKETLRDSRVLYVNKEHLPHLENLLTQIEQESKNDDNYQSFIMNLLIRELLVQLCRYKQNFKPTLSGTDKTIYQISKYISTHYQEPISLSALSREFNMSESYLSRKFKAHTGIGVIEYITYVRITNAEKLLQETDYSVTQIADRCGYSDSNYFSTVFKQIKGITPRQCRKQSNSLY